jgi:coenzyme F420-reducing hydrogenase gamma subunit
MAVWKFASCDGCQLSLLDCEEELLRIAEFVEISYFMEATSKEGAGPYDISLVDGSITTAHDRERIVEVRKQSAFLVTLGTCATTGGIQALRNQATVTDYLSYVYSHPEFISTLDRSTPISAHVKVDYELQGCPVSKKQLAELLSAYLFGRKPNIGAHSVCVECKIRDNVCVMVAHGIPCLGPVTHSGCGALCPTYSRSCYGCYGPKETPHGLSFAKWSVEKLRESPERLARAFQTFYNASESFRQTSRELEKMKSQK